MPSAMIGFGPCGDPNCTLHHMTVVLTNDDGTEYCEPKNIALPYEVWVTIAESILNVKNNGGEMPGNFTLN